MCKRFISMILCILLLLSLVIPAYAEETEGQEEAIVEINISTVDEFLEFAENCRLDSYSQGLTFSLQKDIDLTDIDFNGVPIFCGTFKGNGHTISSLMMEEEGSNLGLFRYLTKAAVVEDLFVRGKITPTGSRSVVGGIAGKNEGLILNCCFIGTVSGNDNVGGLVGINTVTGIIEDSRSSGAVHGNHFVGGIAGENNGVIRKCNNLAQVNTSAQENSVDISDITLESMTNSEAVNSVTDIGGIAGTSNGVIRSCKNWANVGYQHMGYNIGGIAGTQSGYIYDCENYGEVSGRKEVGGIVGQMEPTALIEYEKDALQILQGQLDSMGQTINQAATNAQVGAQDVNNQIYALQDHLWDAMDAVGSLMPDSENPELPDADSIQAAQNGISNSLSGMTSTLWGISETTQSSVGRLSNDLNRLKSQMDAMRTTLGNISETMGGSITDVSDNDTEQDLTGKVESCVNYGNVLADLNAGGIAGAMAMENDLDPEDDWQIQGENSLNFESELRAVILNCENQATVTGKKQNVGGIVGWQSMGLVKNSWNTGTLDAENADYVGGISGQSSGFIRMNYAKCEISGTDYVGGIAGSATILTDCRSMVQLDGREKAGALIGFVEKRTDEEAETQPITGNYYLAVGSDLGAIDGISYAQCGEPLGIEDFLALENLPNMFRRVTLQFVYENGTSKDIVIALGGSLKKSDIPAVPIKDEYVGAWDGLDEFDTSKVLFDKTFYAEYAAFYTTVQSQDLRESGLPILLIQGMFASEDSFPLEALTDAPVISDNHSVIESWKIPQSVEGTHTQLRYLPPTEYQPSNIEVWLRAADGNWTKTEFSEDVSYLVIDINSGCDAICLVNTPIPYGLLAGGVILMACAVIFILLRRKQKRAKAIDSTTT